MTLTTLIRLFLCAAIFCAVVRRGETADAPGKLLVYVGTYTGEKSQGIYAYRARPGQRQVHAARAGRRGQEPFVPGRASQSTSFCMPSTRSATWMASRPAASARLRSTRRAASSSCSTSNRRTAPGPATWSSTRRGKTVLVANYGGGSVASLPIGADGKLGPAASAIQHKGKQRQRVAAEGPHAHSINLDPGNRFAMAADLGLDKVLVYKLDPATSKLTPNDPPAASVKPGSGPRHFAFHPERQVRLRHQRNPLHGHGLRLRRRERRSDRETDDHHVARGRGAEARAQHGRGAGASLGQVLSTARTAGTTACRSSPSTTSRASSRFVENVPTGGKTPRSFGIDPTGRYLLAGNQDSHTIAVFRIDPKTGRLTPTGDKLEVGSPVCVKFVPLP